MTNQELITNAMQLTIDELAEEIELYKQKVSLLEDTFKLRQKYGELTTKQKIAKQNGSKSKHVAKQNETEPAEQKTVASSPKPEAKSEPTPKPVSKPVTPDSRSFGSAPVSF